jgi:hypothetical protein
MKNACLHEGAKVSVNGNPIGIVSQYFDQLSLGQCDIRLLKRLNQSDAKWG